MFVVQNKSDLEKLNKPLYVKELFSAIAKKYDLLNTLMTFSLHNAWKTELVKLAMKEKSDIENVLDACSGTADIAIIINKYLPESKITCLDYCKEMLDVAAEKLARLNLNNIDLILSDLNSFAWTKHSFDLVTIGFGLRNIENREQALNKIYEMLKRNGIFACIDLGYPSNKFLEKIFFSYFFKTVPLLGQLFAQNKEAYSYLPNSLRQWYKQDDLKQLILKTGFKKCYYKNILGGVVAIHVAVK